MYPSDVESFPPLYEKKSCQERRLHVFRQSVFGREKRRYTVYRHGNEN